MDPKKTTKEKSLNEQLLAIAEDADRLTDTEVALTEAYLNALKDLKTDFEEESKEGAASEALAAPAVTVETTTTTAPTVPTM